ncbi:MAG: hypothetical protein M4579_004012 [Chaenotheca gracillima]|nr:MAG: hypothetical protein M4579_004012 [Chaenotheca gracillima]
MATDSRKRGNEWLDADLSEQSGLEADEQGYDSEALEERKGSRTSTLQSRDVKRRRQGTFDENASEREDETEIGSEDEEDADFLEDQEEDYTEEPKLVSLAKTDHPLQKADTTVHGNENPRNSTKPDLKPLTLAQLDAHNRRLRKTGVIYISRIPPYMSPAKVRSLLTPYGALGRIFLTPESSQIHSARVRSHGNKKRSFVDGWVEFESKRDAKLAAETLNAQAVGGKKGGWYHDDLWNMKYLTGFKWADLVEQVKNEEAERAGRLRVGRERGRKEEKEFLKGVERAKVWETKERKKKEREEKARRTGIESKLEAVNDEQKSTQPLPRTFRQNAVHVKPGGQRKSQIDSSKEHRQQQPDQVKRVLNKIF